MYIALAPGSLPQPPLPSKRGDPEAQERQRRRHETPFRSQQTLPNSVRRIYFTDIHQDMSADLKATCHCGAITVLVPHKPDYINDCQCSICRRYAAAWAYYSPSSVEIIVREGGATKKYIWGDREIEFHFCDHCGCIVYWWPCAGQPAVQMGVNSRMMEPGLLAGIERREEEPGS